MLACGCRTESDTREQGMTPHRTAFSRTHWDNTTLFYPTTTRFIAFVMGGISTSSYQRRQRNTRNRTDLSLRPKATGNNTTSRGVSSYRPHVVPLPFPLWAYAWRLCRCCHLLVSIIRVRYVASGVYVMNSTKNLKTTILFKLNDGNLFPAKFHAVFLIQAAGKCCKRLL